MNRSFYLQELEPALKQLADSYFDIVELGGEVVPSLVQIGEGERDLQPKVSQLLQDIEEATKRRLKPQARKLLCSHCLTYCRVHRHQLSWLRKPVEHYGCKSCGQSKNFIFAPGNIIAVLDSEMSMKVTRKMDLIRINWLAHRELFDFDKIEIIQARNEDVERFAVQIGNDTDRERRETYKTMICLVSPDCELSKNTMWVLKEQIGLDIRDINSVRDRYNGIEEIPVC